MRNCPEVELLTGVSFGVLCVSWTGGVGVVEEVTAFGWELFRLASVVGASEGLLSMTGGVSCGDGGV